MNGYSGYNRFIDIIDQKEGYSGFSTETEEGEGLFKELEEILKTGTEGEKLKDYYKKLLRGLLGRYPEYLEKLEGLKSYSFGELLVNELAGLRYDMEGQKQATISLRDSIHVINIAASLKNPDFLISLTMLVLGFILFVGGCIGNILYLPSIGLMVIFVTFFHLIRTTRKTKR